LRRPSKAWFRGVLGSRGRDLGTQWCYSFS
jgi:hypothetical protein